MFSRRTIQTLFDCVSPLLSSGDIADLTGKLNDPSQRLAATWEISICYGLSCIGDVSYQVVLPSKKKPDIAFALLGNNKISFIADVTAVSDDGYHRDNRITAFSRDFAAVVRKFGFDPHNFHFAIESRRVGTKVQLLIPKPNDRIARLKRHLHPFMRDVKRNNRVKHKMVVADPDFAATIEFDRHQRYMSSTYRMYNQARSIDQNPLWNRLEEKADQLRNAEGLVGVIVCDGGCALLSGNAGRDIGSFSADDIIRKFLRTSSSIDFVCTITSRRKHGLSRDCQFVSHTWTRDPTGRPLLEAAMSAMLASLPSPIYDAQNAAIQANQQSYDYGSRTDFSFGINGSGIVSISMSARHLLEILAGMHSPAEIDVICGGPIAEIPGTPNPFKRVLAKGQLITAISIEPVSGKDDDQITIRFGEVDPAVSPFRVRRGI
ncbi:hypothetical protein [Bradyrhizobium sp. 6(2017)]|uniref:hypothetical protein n=1 Tax=Bradyrhizobium sp. 6(2017) TaxID=1197460 RepID=UPI0013E1D89C|nr:hypothetical protein [Bradyrhizobium sp. 6(2017)]QIG92451.1 hypothetical protein G6P99_07980 [Bradyrhizobium sp. 6(2017)]